MSSDNRPTVYVTQDVLVRDVDGEMRRKFDLSSLEEFGNVRFLVQHGQSLVSSVPVVRLLNDLLRDFDGERDYIAPMGDPAIMAAAAAIAAKNSNGRFKVLKWDRRSARYLLVPIDLSGRAL